MVLYMDSILDDPQSYKNMINHIPLPVRHKRAGGGLNI